jgi:hypothetical protein
MRIDRSVLLDLLLIYILMNTNMGYLEFNIIGKTIGHCNITEWGASCSADRKTLVP